MSNDIRPSPLAGRWYPSDPRQLGAMVDEYMGEAATASPLYGLLAPHAGLRYSGPVAGKSFRYTYGLDVDTVVIIAPSHHMYSGGLLSTAHTHFATPLGQVPVATALIDAIDAQVGLKRVADDPEHAVEIELPFLQRTLDEFELLPLVMLDQSWRAASRLGQAVATAVQDRKVLLVASSDLSHFYPQARANAFDQVVLDAVAAYDPEQVIQADREKRGFSCGHGAIAAVMVAAQAMGATSATVVGYATSGDTSGDMSRVVGYGAALFN